MNDDAELLRAYARDGSEPAFRELVGRHLPLVQATARRIVAGDVHLAQDVTQTVFTDLARKAASLPPGVILGGWLHRHTCFTAAKAVRTEQRRRARERTAMELNATNDNAGEDAQWARLAPVLDEALNGLDDDDRDAIVLRYFEQRDLRAVGAALGISDDTAQKRVSRALEKLRAILTNRGLAVPVAFLATALDLDAKTAAEPESHIRSVSAIALGSFSRATGLAHGPSTIKTMIISKRFLGIAGTALTIIVALAVYSQIGTSALPLKAQPPAGLTGKPVGAKNSIGVEAPKLSPAPAGDAPAPSDNSTLAVQFLGEVNRPGQITSDTGKLTLVQAFAQAGGPKADAGTSVDIVRVGPNGTTKVLKNVDLQGATKNATKDISLQDGDVITLGVSSSGALWN